MDGLEQDRELIRALVAFANIAPATMARQAGVSPSTIQRPYSGTASTRLGRSALEKLQAAFPDFPGWEKGATAEHRLPFRGFAAERDPDLVELDEIDLRYGMGGTYLDGPIVAEKRAFSRELLRHLTHSAPEHLFWAIGDGDSMEPTIRSGELILIDRSQLSPRSGDGIWAFAWGDVGMIKRLRPLPDGTVEIHSDNDRIRPALAADDDLHVIGRVVAVVRRL
ncbi:MAG: S24 family peptidase [Novosphingobium sp.]|uniref:S24 family peptidase n=1 Tax=Novosphingobium sp. TaxID=1874826 RepID=UPI0032BC24B8